jgi:hypothetical protein
MGEKRRGRWSHVSSPSDRSVFHGGGQLDERDFYVVGRIAQNPAFSAH